MCDQRGWSMVEELRSSGKVNIIRAHELVIVVVIGTNKKLY